MPQKPSYEDLEKRIKDIEQAEFERVQSEKEQSVDKDQDWSILYNIQAAVVVHSADTKIIASNSEAQKLLGLTNAQMFGKEAIDNRWQFLDMDNKKLPLDQYPVNQVLSTRQVLRDQTVGIYRPETDDIVWVIISANPVYNQEKKIEQVIVTFMDITKLKQAVYEREQAEEALRASEKKYQSLFNNAQVALFRTSIDGKLIEINKQYAEMAGYSNIEDCMAEFNPGDAWAQPDERKELVKIIQKKGFVKDYEAKIIRRDGTHIWILFSATIFPEKGFMEGSIVEITDRKWAEEALQSSEKKYHAIFNDLMDVYFKTTLDGVIENASPSSETVSGYSAAELIGKKVDMLYHNPKDREGLLNELKKKGQVRSFEVLFKKKNGALYHASISADLNYNKDGQPINLTGTIRDISESKQSEKEKIKAQKIAGDNEKLALVGQIAGKMAHDFNNVLGIIMGHTELSLLDCVDPQIKKTLELIYKQSIRGKNLTKNLVAFAKDQEPKQEFFRINEKIDLVINLLKKDLEGIEMIKENKAGVPDLLADTGMIEHALVNLVQNSIHATSMVEYPRIILRTYSLDNHICFEIEDNGCGISEEHLKTIYEPSFTLKGNRDVTGSYKTDIKGTGYGMANVKKYIEQHKGIITVESELGSGTKFTFSLPVIKKELTSEEKIKIQLGKVCFEKYILLVEDETDIADVQYRILTQEPCNHKVDIAHNGKVAMDLIGRNKYDLVSLDYILPGNINGMDIYNHIREIDKTIPILFISGNIQFLESIKDLKQKDANIDHLSKPCQNKDYAIGINNLLEKTLTEE
jgi:PAS domain S-box-containing protein